MKLFAFNFVGNGKSSGTLLVLSETKEDAYKIVRKEKFTGSMWKFCKEIELGGDTAKIVYQTYLWD